MSIYETLWDTFRTEYSELPTDVVFNVIENIEVEEGDIENYKAANIVAHKFLLAGVSPVFRKEFFGPLKETGTIVIKETTIEAFTLMINYIYKPTETFDIANIKSPQTLFQVLNLAERYQIIPLVKKVEVVLESLKITSSNLLTTAATAKQYEMFPNASSKVLNNCSNFLDVNLKTADDVYYFLLKSQSSSPDTDPLIIFELMRSIAKCPNCGTIMRECLNGKVASGTLKVGTIVQQEDVTNGCGFECWNSFNSFGSIPNNSWIGVAQIQRADTNNSTSSFGFGTITYGLKCLYHNREGGPSFQMNGITKRLKYACKYKK